MVRYTSPSMAYGRSSPSKTHHTGFKIDFGKYGRQARHYFNQALPYIDHAVDRGLHHISPHFQQAYQGIKRDVYEKKGAGDTILNAVDTARHGVPDLLEKIPGGGMFTPLANAGNDFIDSIKQRDIRGAYNHGMRVHKEFNGVHKRRRFA